ncbi:MAG: hypothetical protein RR696_12575, partial [Clostridia bacterium]
TSSNHLCGVPKTGDCGHDNARRKRIAKVFGSKCFPRLNKPMRNTDKKMLVEISIRDISASIFL